MSVQRYERCDNFMIVGSAMKDGNGFLRDTPTVARTGVYVYLNADGTTRREYRPPQEVFSDDSLASFIGKPITVDHPKGAVTSKTVRRLSIGTILSQGYNKGDGLVGCDVVIHDPDAIGDRRELSLGYKVDLEEKAGVTPEGEPYDAIQHNIRINHLAVVETARAGHMARLNMDGNEIIESEVQKMSTIKIDAKDYEVDEVIASHINALTAKADESQAKADEAKGELETAQKALDELKEQVAEKQKEVDSLAAERDAEKAKAEKAEKEKADAIEKAKADTKAEIAERAMFEETAKLAKVDGFENMDNMAIKVAVIKAVRGDSFETEGKSDGYMDAAFDFAVADLKSGSDAVKKQLEKLHDKKDSKDEEVNDAASAREKMLATYRK